MRFKIIFLSLYFLVKSKAINDGLYTPDDYVHILTKDNFHSSLQNETEFWVIEFYASWCGHCVHFAPTIKNLGIDIQNWTRLLHFGVIDCGNPKNTEICSDNKITGFPTIKYFLPGPRNFSTPAHVDGRTMELIRTQVVELISENKIQKSSQIDFEDLQEENDLEESFKIIKNEKNIEYFILILGFKIVKHSLGFTSDDLIADFSTFENVAIRKSDESKSISDHFKISTFPSILLINPETEKVLKTIQIDLNADLPRSRYSEEISRDLDISPVFVWKSQKLENSENLEIAGPDWSEFDQSKIYIQDIESAILSFLFHDIITFPLAENSLTAIKNFVDAISKIYPSTSRNVDMYLKNLNDNLKNVSKIKKRKDWISQLNQSGLTKLQGESPKLQYAACKPSVAGLRGYTCGLWSSFHFFLSNCPDENSNFLANSISEIILEHFKCLECRNNFKTEIEQFPIENVKDQNSGIIWLWSIHNSVNSRLAGSDTEDPEFPKTQFPTSQQCPKCENEDKTFNKIEIVNFLKTRFSLDNFVFFENENLIQNNLDRIEEDDEEEEIISPSKSRIRPGWIWFILVLLSVAGLFLWRCYRLKVRLKRSYRKFYHQL